MRTLMVCGGVAPTIDFYLKVTKQFEPECLIAVDSGVLFMDRYHIVPDHLIGDLDSSGQSVISDYRSKTHIIELERDKDETDTQMAIRYASEIGTTELTILGALGNRLDHTIGNMRLLIEAEQLGVRTKIMDEQNTLLLVDKRYELIGQKNKTISLIAFSEQASGIMINGFRYPLIHETLRFCDVRGISNVVISDYATIDLQQGTLLLVINETV